MTLKNRHRPLPQGSGRRHFCRLRRQRLCFCQLGSADPGSHGNAAPHLGPDGDPAAVRGGRFALALPTAGHVVGRIGTANAIRAAGLLAALAGAGIALSLCAESVVGTAISLFFFGIGIGLWDVSQNIEGADVEHKLGRTIMPQFHAAFSGGAFIGALIGAGLSTLGVGLPAHLLVIAAVVVAAALLTPRYFLPHEPEAAPARGEPGRAGPARLAGRPDPADRRRRPGRHAHRRRRQRLDRQGRRGRPGHAEVHRRPAVCRLCAGDDGHALLWRPGDRRLRPGGSAQCQHGAAALPGLASLFSPATSGWPAGAALWGVGAALAFPVGMSAAADDPKHAAARVSVVSTLGYIAFLAGPPLLGYLGDVDRHQAGPAGDRGSDPGGPAARRGGKAAVRARGGCPCSASSRPLIDSHQYGGPTLSRPGLG